MHDLTQLMLPPSLEELVLARFTGLLSLSGAERWTRLRLLELFDCPRLASLEPVAGMTSLEVLGIGTLQTESFDFSPLARLPRLREIAHMGHNAFDLTPLRGKPGITIHVPVNCALTGADHLGPGAAIEEFIEAPRMHLLNSAGG
jgi:hypothetical protein